MKWDGLSCPLALLLLALAGACGAEAVPGSGFAEARALLEAGQNEECVALLAGDQEPEALALRAAAHLAAGDYVRARADLGVALAAQRAKGAWNQKLTAYLLSAWSTSHPVIQAIRVAEDKAVTRLVAMLGATVEAGDPLGACPVAVALLRIDPVRAEALDFVKGLPDREALAGCWIPSLYPSLLCYGEHTGVWEEDPVENAMIGTPNGLLLGRATLAVGNPAPATGFDVSVTFAPITLDPTDHQPGVGLQLGDFDTWDDCLIQGGKWVHATRTNTGEAIIRIEEPGAPPIKIDQSITAQVSVFGAAVQFLVGGEPVLSLEVDPARFTGKHLGLVEQYCRLKVTDLRWRPRAVAPAAPSKRERAELKGLLQKKDATAFELANRLAAAAPDDGALQVTRAEAALIVGRKDIAIAAYRHVLSLPDGGGQRRKLERALKPLAAEPDVASVLKTLNQELGSAATLAAKRDLVAEWALLEARARARGLSAKEGARLRQLRSENPGASPWQELPMVKNETWGVAGGNWTVEGGSATIDDSNSQNDLLLSPYRVGNAFEFKCKARMRAASRPLVARRAVIALFANAPVTRVEYVLRWPDSLSMIVATSPTVATDRKCSAFTWTDCGWQEEEWRELTVRVDGPRTWLLIDGELWGHRVLPAGWQEMVGRGIAFGGTGGRVEFSSPSYREWR